MPESRGRHTARVAGGHSGHGFGAPRNRDVYGSSLTPVSLIKKKTIIKSVLRNQARF